MSSTESRQKLIQQLRKSNWRRLQSSAISWFSQVGERFPILKRKPVIAAILLLLVFVIVQQINFGHSLDDLKKNGELLVISRESPTTWYQDKEGSDTGLLGFFSGFANLTHEIGEMAVGYIGLVDHCDGLLKF